jgi:hypothetical protein
MLRLDRSIQFFLDSPVKPTIYAFLGEAIIYTTASGALCETISVFRAPVDLPNDALVTKIEIFYNESWL